MLNFCCTFFFLWCRKIKCKAVKLISFREIFDLSKVERARVLTLGITSSSSGLLAMFMLKTFAKICSIIFPNAPYFLLLFFTEDQIVSETFVCYLSRRPFCLPSVD